MVNTFTAVISIRAECAISNVTVSDVFITEIAIESEWAFTDTGVEDGAVDTSVISTEVWLCAVATTSNANSYIEATVDSSIAVCTLTECGVFTASWACDEGCVDSTGITLIGIRAEATRASWMTITRV